MAKKFNSREDLITFVKKTMHTSIPTNAYERYYFVVNGQPVVFKEDEDTETLAEYMVSLWSYPIPEDGAKDLDKYIQGYCKTMYGCQDDPQDFKDLVDYEKAMVRNGKHYMLKAVRTEPFITYPAEVTAMYKDSPCLDYMLQQEKKKEKQAKK